MMGVSTGFLLCGASGVVVGAAAEDGTVTDSWIWVDDATVELEDSLVELEDAGGGSGGETPLSERGAVEELSANVEESVPVVSASLVLASTSEEEASAEESELPRNSDSMKDGKSICRDESCSEVLLDV
jgi:hypothetical protein